MVLFKPEVQVYSNLHTLLLFCILYFAFLPSYSQAPDNILKGKVKDASTGKVLFGVAVSCDSLSNSDTTLADGSYLLKTKKGEHKLIYSLPGYQTKEISGAKTWPGTATYVDVMLVPLSAITGNAEKGVSTDSAKEKSSVFSISFFDEIRRNLYNPRRFANAQFDHIPASAILPGTDKNASQLLKRLNGVIVQEYPGSKNLQSLNIFGLGERYNQVLLNGAPFNSFDMIGRAYPLDFLPVEAIESAGVHKIAGAALPADFAGGTVDIKTKDFPDRNFYYLQAGGGFSEDTRGKQFFGDKKGRMEWTSFPGPVRNLPSSFPTTRSQSGLNEKNPQEQVYLSKLINNNLGPRNYGTSEPNTSVLLGFGKSISLKQGGKLGIIAFLNHQNTQLIDETTVQASPDLSANPFPFTDAGQAIMRSVANDINYRYASQLSGILNASVFFGKNKISFKNIFGSQFAKTFTQRSGLYKADDDSLAHVGINYVTEDRKFLNTQLSGEHALGNNNKLKLSWSATYTYHKRQNPDERNFLLRQDSAGKDIFEIAQQSGVNSNVSNGRRWKNLTDHNFTGRFDIQAPFRLFNQAQVLTGGIFIQNRYRVFFSDLLVTKGPGYFTLDELLAPERYYPGGLSIENYFLKKDMYSGDPTVFEYNRANYTASANTGAAYLSLENRLIKSVTLNWGLRTESNSQMASNTQYEYFKGYKNPQMLTIDKNIRVSQFDFLPSATINFQPVNAFQLHGSYFKTVNRPQLQELSYYRDFNAISFLATTGNPLLANSNIQNYDAGISWIPYAGTTISISGFYKQIDRPIEYIVTGYLQGTMIAQPHNTPPATVKGIAAAFKTKLDFIAPVLSCVSVFGNGNWLRSKVSAGPVKSEYVPEVAAHTLSGSPEYTMNAGLVVQPKGLPHITVLYSRTGDYITALGSGSRIVLNNGNPISAIPDYRIGKRQQLDIQVSQQFLKSRLQIILGVNNLLKDAYTEYQDLNGNKEFDNPLILTNRGNTGGFYKSGIDNTLVNINIQRAYYLKLSYLFK